MCGEHFHAFLAPFAAEGSSPHVRGARHVQGRDHRRRGIIPACAGSTRSKCFLRCSRRDHPRMCGEHLFDVPAEDLAEGSSPHVRGAQRILNHGTHLIGIIPACAGSTSEVPFIVGLVRGSSPHVRGARSSCRGVVPPIGIIPACAGSTFVLRCRIAGIWDHPRMCGEHPSKIA